MVESCCFDDCESMAEGKREIWFREQPGSLVYIKPVHWKAFALYAAAIILWIGCSVAMDTLGLLQSNFALVLIPLVVVLFGTVVIAGLHTGRVDNNSSN